MVWKSKKRWLDQAIEVSETPMFWVLYETAEGESGTINVFANSTKQAKKKAMKSLKDDYSQEVLIKEVMSI